MKQDTNIQNDLGLLNGSLAGEYFGIAAYQAALDSGLLEDGVADVATTNPTAPARSGTSQIHCPVVTLYR